MSWTPHVAHNLSAGEYVQKNPGFLNVFTSAHLAGVDGTEWGHHGNDDHKPSTKEAADVRKGCEGKTGIFLNGKKFFYISGKKEEGDTLFGFRNGPVSAGVYYGKTYTAIIIANDRIVPCTDAVECFAGYLKGLQVE